MNHQCDLNLILQEFRQFPRMFHLHLLWRCDRKQMDISDKWAVASRNRVPQQTVGYLFTGHSSNSRALFMQTSTISLHLEILPFFSSLMSRSRGSVGNSKRHILERRVIQILFSFPHPLKSFASKISAKIILLLMHDLKIVRTEFQKDKIKVEGRKARKEGKKKRQAKEEDRERRGEKTSIARQ